MKKNISFSGGFTFKKFPIENTMGLEDLTLTVDICKTCGTVMIATKDKRLDFTEDEKATINRIAELMGKKIRWQRRSIPDWAHVHLE